MLAATFKKLQITKLQFQRLKSTQNSNYPNTDKEINHLKSELTKVNLKIVDLNTQLTDPNTQLMDQNTQLTDQNTQLKDLKTQLKKMNIRLGYLEMGQLLTDFRKDIGLYVFEKKKVE
jgi:peptidoglycan hydrolase CwlO-like protein